MAKKVGDKRKGAGLDKITSIENSVPIKDFKGNVIYHASAKDARVWLYLFP